MIEKSKLWLIGDSFTGMYDYSWTKILSDKFKGESYYVSSQSSRDFQSVLDCFLRKLKDIGENDLVIVFFPLLERLRLPLNSPLLDVEYSNKFTTYEHKLNHLEYFVGLDSYEKSDPSKQLESPFDEFSENLLEENLKLQRMIFESKASIKNYLEILQSIKSYVPFNLEYFTWENEIESDFIMNKNKITDTIGFWESHHIVYLETNGVSGKKDDFHWSPKMHKAFADYVIVKFSQYFNL
jgi:hypothetical protein